MDDFYGPPLVQPHGALIVLDGKDLRIVGASESVRAIFGLSHRDLVGHPIERLAAAANIAGLRDAVSSETPFELTTHLRRRLQVTTRGQGDHLVVELETADTSSRPDTFAVLGSLRPRIARLRQATNLDGLVDLVSHEVKAISGFDRIVVRTVGDDETSAHYVPTTTYEPSVVHTTATTILPDLRCAELWSPSVDTLADLRARGITATMEIGGLICGYHRSGPHRVSHEARVACGLIAEVFASLVDQHRRVEIVSTARLRARKVA